MRKIIEYRVWFHPRPGGDDFFFKFDKIKTAQDFFKNQKDMSKLPLHGIDARVETPLVVYKEGGKYWESSTEDLNIRTKDMIYGLKEGYSDVE